MGDNYPKGFLMGYEAPRVDQAPSIYSADNFWRTEGIKDMQGFLRHKATGEYYQISRKGLLEGRLSATVLVDGRPAKQEDDKITGNTFWVNLDATNMSDYELVRDAFTISRLQNMYILATGQRAGGEEEKKPAAQQKQQPQYKKKAGGL